MKPALVVALVLAVVAGRWQGSEPATESNTRPPSGWGRLRIGPLLRAPRRRAALAALLGGQVAMVLVMTMTPLHIHAGGGDLVLVGLVISAHTLGMFALSPVSARLVSRRGAMPVALGGMAVIVTSVVLAAAAPPHAGPLLALALFLLGFGWNLCFVAGSAMLVEGGPSAAQTAHQGAADFLVFLAAAVASIGSGALFAAAGFAAMSLVAGVLLIVPALVIVRERYRSGEPARA